MVIPVSGCSKKVLPVGVFFQVLLDIYQVNRSEVWMFIMEYLESRIEI